ncbi:hypothetical protein BD410DRAFT_741603, partial [Rickenella mellea]
MAQQAAYPQIQQRGTLVPGQTINVNKYTVQVERYLSQGGFAHVYLVRTATPIYNTNQHVLKRIAVPNEAMLSEVKKEVDIMRILRGHPNIVYLIDAAWHRMSNGAYEVFILMEFCPGGGIIDMMNRRLRERLTEGEILQIFVDVCEGVAAMHNLRPALLHRDLKVENILQASQTSFKLCDFGSAMSVAPRVPSTSQEIRALEADLNKHTTLQYRAPEMVDPYLRRPVDEKSDVWALGVLLYKLCYYTTPFEEHGVLAILNVQYRIPPYPVYSPHLNSLIASMLKDHGTQRPSVFELLDTVHRMRGTKSRFNYNPPPPQPLSPRVLQTSKAESLNNQVLYTQPPSRVSNANNGIQARDRVLEAIAPMRRGRPSVGNISPSKDKFPDDAFATTSKNDDDAWKTLKANSAAKAHKSGIIPSSVGDEWKVKNTPANPLGALKSEKKQTPTGLSYNFSVGFGDSFESSFLSTTSNSSGKSASKPISISASDIKQIPLTRGSAPLGDAFESLNVFPSPKPPPPTMGEVQKSGVSSTRPRPSPSRQSMSSFSVSPSPSPMLVPSPAPSTSSQQQQLLPPAINHKSSDQSLSAEKRFPTLEELDAETFATAAQARLTQSASQPQQPTKPVVVPERPAQVQSARSNFSGGLHPPTTTPNSLGLTIPRQDGVRSQQVTGTAMRESRQRARNVPSPSQISLDTSSNELDKAVEPFPTTPMYESPARRSGRPVLERKHRSSISVRPKQRTGGGDPSPIGNKNAEPLHGGVPAPSTTSTQPPHDWLTGDDFMEFDNAIVRASPEKRASLMLPSAVETAQTAQEQAHAGMTWNKEKPLPEPQPKRRSSPVKTDLNSSRKDMILGDAKQSVNMTSKGDSSSDEEPEDASGFTKDANRRTRTKGRQSSVHDLVDLWDSASSNPPKPTTSKISRRTSAFATTSPSKPEHDSGGGISGLPISSSPRPNLDGPSSPANFAKRPRAFRKQASSSTTDPSVPPASRSRPQSLYIFPVQKATSEVTPAAASPLLSPPILSPPEGHRSKSSGRRSSISDIVSRYEAIGVIKPKPAPAPAAKPARLKMGLTGSTTTEGSVASPTAASARFPKLSPANSPIKAKAFEDAQRVQKDDAQ